MDNLIKKEVTNLEENNIKEGDTLYISDFDFNPIECQCTGIFTKENDTLIEYCLPNKGKQKTSIEKIGRSVFTSLDDFKRAVANAFPELQGK